MTFCPNCGRKLPAEGLKFCPECGKSLEILTLSEPGAARTHVVRDKVGSDVFELLKNEIAQKPADLAKSVCDSLVHEWKASGKYPKRFGGIVDAVVERALPAVVEAKVRSMPWTNGEAEQTSAGGVDTSVSTSFPVEIQTEVPLLGKIRIEEVRITIKGLVDVASGSVNQLRVGGVSLA